MGPRDTTPRRDPEVIFPGGSVVKSPPTMREIRVLPLGREDPLEKEMGTHSSILAWRIHGQRSLVDASS